MFFSRLSLLAAALCACAIFTTPARAIPVDISVGGALDTGGTFELGFRIDDTEVLEAAIISTSNPTNALYRIEDGSNASRAFVTLDGTRQALDVLAYQVLFQPRMEAITDAGSFRGFFTRMQLVLNFEEPGTGQRSNAFVDLLLSDRVLPTDGLDVAFATLRVADLVGIEPQSFDYFLLPSGAFFTGTVETETIVFDPIDPVAPVPLPTSMWAILGALGMLGAFRIRRRQNAHCN
ncbi:MAG: VPLPA-CTERM sorting domain-containing protein [Pseudomonadota bacterium]